MFVVFGFVVCVLCFVVGVVVGCVRVRNFFRFVMLPILIYVVLGCVPIVHPIRCHVLTHRVFWFGFFIGAGCRRSLMHAVVKLCGHIVGPFYG